MKNYTACKELNLPYPVYAVFVILVDITRFMKFDEIYILSLQPYYIHSEDISIPGIQFISILSDI